jgi:plastocyanin
MPSVKASSMITVSFLLGVGAAVAAAGEDAEPSPAPSVCPSAQPVAADPEASLAATTAAPSMPATDPCDAPPTAATEVTEVTVEAGDLWFRPNEIRIPAEGTSTITLLDKGYITHNLTIDALDVVVIASPRGSGTVELVDPAPGTYQFYCSISGHREAGMVGTLIVE